MVQLAPHRYLVPQGRVGKGFLQDLSKKISCVQRRQWNSEKPLVFVAVVLQVAHGVKQSKDIRAKIESRLALWRLGHYTALLDVLVAEAHLRDGQMFGPQTDEQSFHAFNTRLLSGHVRSACQNLTNQAGGGVLLPTDLCTKTCHPVLDVLQSKHPAMRDPLTLGDPDSVFEPYDSVPDVVFTVVTSDIVEEVFSKLSGAAGPRGTDTKELKTWLLRYRAESTLLREEMAAFAN